MHGKTNYKNIDNKIKNSIKEYDGETVVIYCIDVDKYFSNADDHKFFEDVKEYCIEKGYRFVHFSKEIENVIWQKDIDDNMKVKMANKFIKDGVITKDLINRLSSESLNNGCSNLLLVINGELNSH